jgi:hypothetical protein
MTTKYMLFATASAVAVLGLSPAVAAAQTMLKWAHVY